MQVIVLGMHRSGTSVLARMLNLMGLYFGPEGLSTGANPENPKGFWERRDVRYLNDALLHSTGSDWNRVSGFDLDAVPAEMESAFNEVAFRTVLEMDAHRPWFIKEPRLCLLLPAWLRHLEVPVVVNVYRDPVEVAASMQSRNGIPLEAGLELWEYYVRSAANAAAGLPSINVLHSAIMADPEGMASYLYRELGRLGVGGIRQATSRELASFIDPKLHRQRRDSHGLERYRSSRESQLYKRLVEEGTGALLQGSPREWPALMDYEKGLPALQPPKPSHVRASGYGVFSLDQRMKSNVRSIGRLEVQLTEVLEERLAKLERGMDGGSGEEKPHGSRDQMEIEVALDEAIVQRERRLAAQAAQSEQESGQLETQHERDASEIRKLNKKIAEQDGQLLRHRRERRRLLGALEAEHKLSNSLREEIAQLTTSRSWQLTGPLRWLAGKLRGLRE